jgi:hypothetical protein
MNRISRLILAGLILLTGHLHAVTLSANGTTDLTLIPGRIYTAFAAGTFGSGTLTLTFRDHTSGSTVAFRTITAATTFEFRAPNDQLRAVLTGATAPAIEFLAILAPLEGSTAGISNRAGVIAGIAADPSATRGASKLREWDVTVPLVTPAPGGWPTVTHPSVVDAGTAGFGGYRYWLAFTPWPVSGVGEDPCILASHDMVDWVLPSGASNPIATEASVNAAIGSGLFTYNSDTHLLLDGGVLKCYYRAVKDAVRESIILQTTTNGVTWTAPDETLRLEGATTTKTLSPAIVKVGSTYYMYVIDRATGGLSEHQKCRRYDSVDGLSWSNVTTCTMPQGQLMLPWHLDMQMRDGAYHMLLYSTALNNPLLYFSSTDGTTFTGDANTSAVPIIGTYDGAGYYRSCMIPSDDGDRWHVFVSGVPRNQTANGITGEMWHIGLRPNMVFSNKNTLRQNSFGIQQASIDVSWKTPTAIASGASVDLPETSSVLTEGSPPLQGSRVDIWGLSGSAAIAGIWVTTTAGTQIGSALTTTTKWTGIESPRLYLTALPDNVTPVSGDVVTGSTSGATAVFHRLRGASPAQYTLRSFSGTAIFQVGEQIKVNAVTATNAGTPVTISALSMFPIANAANLMLIDHTASYAGRFQIWNTFASSAYVTVEIHSAR